MFSLSTFLLFSVPTNLSFNVLLCFLPRGFWPVWLVLPWTTDIMLWLACRLLPGVSSDTSVGVSNVDSDSTAGAVHWHCTNNSTTASTAVTSTIVASAAVISAWHCVIANDISSALLCCYFFVCFEFCCCISSGVHQFPDWWPNLFAFHHCRAAIVLFATACQTTHQFDYTVKLLQLIDDYFKQETKI